MEKVASTNQASSSSCLSIKIDVKMRKSQRGFVFEEITYHDIGGNNFDLLFCKTRATFSSDGKSSSLTSASNSLTGNLDVFANAQNTFYPFGVQKASSHSILSCGTCKREALDWIVRSLIIVGWSFFSCISILLSCLWYLERSLWPISLYTSLYLRIFFAFSLEDIVKFIINESRILLLSFILMVIIELRSERRHCLKMIKLRVYYYLKYKEQGLGWKLKERDNSIQ